jgi:hypothetical protein
MPIDDPIKAAETQLAAEERERSPVRRYVSKVSDFVPNPIANALSNFLRDDSEAKLQYLIDVMKDEIAYLRSDVERLISESKQYRQFTENVWPSLVLDAFRKAEQTRAKDRIERIGHILTQSLMQSPPPSGDEVEELMRIAMDLSDREVSLLAEIARLQGPALTGDGSPTQFSQTSWAAARLPQLGMNVEDVFSIGPKLESFGLIRETLESRRGTSVPRPWPYALLPKGLRFLELAKRRS